MKNLRLIFKWPLRLLTGFLLLTGLYFLAAGIGCCLAVNTDFRESPDGIPIAVLSNGIHTDIVVPARNEITDWTKELPYSDVQQADSSYRYLSFGWGDKGFYIETPDWADLKTSTTCKALFWMSSSAMHVSWRKAMPGNTKRSRSFRIPAEKYRELCAFIRESFERKNGNLQHIAAKGYGAQDAFYEANGTYNLFETCNVWTGRALKVSGIRVAAWTPFERSIFQQLPSGDN